MRKIKITEEQLDILRQNFDVSIEGPNDNNMNTIIKTLMQTQEVARQMHLMAVSKKLSEHEALEDFYNDLLEHTDLFVEVYQGQFGLVSDFEQYDKPDLSDPIDYFTKFVKIIEGYKAENPKETSHFDTIYDDIIIASYKLLYKLKFLN